MKQDRYSWRNVTTAIYNPYTTAAVMSQPKSTSSGILTLRERERQTKTPSTDAADTAHTHIPTTNDWKKLSRSLSLWASSNSAAENPAKLSALASHSPVRQL